MMRGILLVKAEYTLFLLVGVVYILVLKNKERYMI
jgi:hypothetical protein